MNSWTIVLIKYSLPTGVLKNDGNKIKLFLFKKKKKLTDYTVPTDNRLEIMVNPPKSAIWHML